MIVCLLSHGNNMLKKYVHFLSIIPHNPQSRVLGMNLSPMGWWACLRDVELKNKTLAKISCVMIIGLNVKPD